MAFWSSTQDNILIIVDRDSSSTGKSLLGTFTAGNVSGVTLENDDKKISKGTYDAKIYNSPRFGRKVILFEYVSGRSDIEIHHGNYYSDTTGCILVGTSIGKDVEGNGTISTSVAKLNALIKECEGKKIQVQVQ